MGFWPRKKEPEVLFRSSLSSAKSELLAVAYELQSSLAASVDIAAAACACDILEEMHDGDSMLHGGHHHQADKVAITNVMSGRV